MFSLSAPLRLRVEIFIHKFPARVTMARPVKLPAFLSALFIASTLLAAEKQVPPPGVKISDADRKELETGVASARSRH